MRNNNKKNTTSPQLAGFWVGCDAGMTKSGRPKIGVAKSGRANDGRARSNPVMATGET